MTNKNYTAEQIQEIQQLCKSFFYSGMTFEEFGMGKRNGGPCIPKNMTCGEYLHFTLKQKGLL